MSRILEIISVCDYGRNFDTEISFVVVVNELQTSYFLFSFALNKLVDLDTHWAGPVLPSYRGKAECSSSQLSVQRDLVSATLATRSGDDKGATHSKCTGGRVGRPFLLCVMGTVLFMGTAIISGENIDNNENGLNILFLFGQRHKIVDLQRK